MLYVTKGGVATTPINSAFVEGGAILSLQAR